jgi:uncharacterized cupin superfamily protein
MTTKPVINIADVPLRQTNDAAGHFSAEVGSFGKTIGSSGIGCMLHVVQPGKKAFPYHVHHQIHELFVILEGTGEYRFGSERYPVKAGDVLAAPTGGPEVAHQLLNTGATVMKYLGISTVAQTEVVEYPDSGKFAVNSRFDWTTGKGGVRHIARPGTGLDYYDGET